jgi:predicted ATPase/serine/threonine protein kinase/Tfp pilus assembly protein PilF
VDSESEREIVNGRYRIVRLLGRGGMGKVALAQDLAENGRELALKSVPRGEGREDFAHMQHEFLTLSRLRHPNVAEVYDFGVIEGTGEVFFTSEYVNGIDLLEATAKATWEELTDWVVQICRGLEYVHSRGLIHYDVKPGNILVMPREGGALVKLIDFGLAGSRTPLPTGTIKGTVSYMAPEVAGSAAVDKRADLYSLGCTLYQCVTRELPFRGANNIDVIKQHLYDTAREPRELRPDLPDAFRALVLRLMEKEPGHRFASANDVIRSINETTGRNFEVETKESAVFYVASGSFVGRDREFSVLARAFEHAIGETRQSSREKTPPPKKAVAPPAVKNEALPSTKESIELDFSDAPPGTGSKPESRSDRREREAREAGPAPRDAAPSKRLILVSGESGVGKRRLLREFKTWAQLREVAVVEGRAQKGGAPYAPFAQVFRGILHLFPAEAGSKPARHGALREGPGREGRDPLRARLLRHYGRELARLIPEIELDESAPQPSLASLGPEQERLRLFDALAQFVLRFAQARPLVILLHELHDADTETTELLRYLARNLELAERAREMAPRWKLSPPLPLRLLVVASYRSSDTAGRPLEPALAELSRAREATELPLGRLSSDEVERLVQSMLGVDAKPRALAQRVYQETKGNPFFVVELMRSLVESGTVRPKDGAWRARLDEPGALRIPATVADVIIERVERLTKEERAPLELLAVLGRPATDAELLALGDGLSREALVATLDSLEKRQIVVADTRADGQVAYSFIHVLARDKIHESVSAQERQRLHGRAGRLLEARIESEASRSAAPVDLSELVRHFEEAREPLRALEYAVRAGDAARALYASREAIQHYERALALAAMIDANPSGSTPSRRRIDLLERLADVLALSGDYERAARVMEELRAASSALEPRERARVERRTGELEEKRGSYDNALDAFARGIQALGSEVRSKEGAQLLGATASIYVKKGLYERAVEFCDAGLDLLKGAALEASPGHSLEMETAQLRTILGVARSCRGELELAEKEFEHALVARRRSGDAIGTARSLANLGAVAVERGLIDEAVARFEAALELEEKLEHGPGIAEAAAQLARALRTRGDLERAIGLSRRALALQEKAGDVEGQVASWNDLGTLHDSLGEYGRALECFRTAVHRNEGVGEAREAARALNGEAIVLARAGAVKMAAGLAQEALRLASLHSIRREEARAFRTLARVALANGSPDEAEQYAHCAHVLYERLGSRREAILITLDVAKACTDRGDHAITERLLDEVEKESRALGFDRLEATFVLARAESRLAKGGLSTMALIDIVQELERASGMAERARARELLWRVDGARGAALVAAGSLEDAVPIYVRAMETIKKLHAELPGELQASYLKDPERKRVSEQFRALRARIKEREG